MKKQKIVSIFFILAFFFCSLHKQTIVYAEENWPTPPDISAPSAIVMEVDSGAILYEKNSHDQHYPASITKIMTALLALENCSLSETVHFSQDSIYKVEGTQVGIIPDEELSMEECLYGLMLASGNEIAYGISEHVGGTFDNFINMMNERAAELGCTDTHFNNPHGLPDENHYTSAYDMALISRKAFQNETFRTISGTKYHVIPPTNLSENERPLSNHHKMLINSSYHYDYCIGGKTGYTNAARYNLVTFAEKNGMVLLCVVMKDEESALQYSDTTNLFNYCFDNFSKINIADTGLGNSLDSSGLFPLEKNVFYENAAAISFEDNASVILPNSVDMSALTTSVSYEGTNSTDNAVFIKYNYGEHLLGCLPVTYQSINEAAATANAIKLPENENYFKINVKIILYVVIGIIAAALIALIILKIVFRQHYTNAISFHNDNKKRENSWRSRHK